MIEKNSPKMITIPDSKSLTFSRIKIYAALLSAIFFVSVGIIRTDTLWITLFTSQIQEKYGERMKIFYSQWTKIISLISLWSICKEVDLSLATKLVISYYNWLPNKYIKISYIYIHIYIYYIYITYIIRHLGTHIIFNQLLHIISSFLVDEIYLTLEIRIWLKIVLLYLLIIFQILLQQFPADKQWIWNCIGY